MSQPPRELLVVLEPGVDADAVASAAGGRVSQRLPGRVALMLVPESSRAELASLGDVRGVFAHEVPDEVRDELDGNERMFVDAWRARGQERRRVGDGLSWDAPGFRAP